MSNEALVYFALKGENFDPDRFTELSGLSPTDVLRKGTPRKCGRGTYTFGMWEISMGWEKNDVLIIHDIVDELVGRIDGYAEKIASAVADQGLRAVLEVVLYVSMDERISTPALGFSTKTIAFLSRVGAEIDVDIYRNE